MPTRLATICALAMMTYGSAAAAHVSYENPYDDAPHHGLRFADLEFTMPTDPLLWSNDPGTEAHHTPASIMADATRQLRAAIPEGTPAQAATASLKKAGARCTETDPTALKCRYRTIETPSGDDYWDDVTWNITVPLSQGRVADLIVTRDWTRR